MTEDSKLTAKAAKAFARNIDEQPKLSREATAKAFAKHKLANPSYSGEWKSMGELFAEDARYHDSFYGWMYGRDAITEWLYRSMIGIEDWSYPVEWTVVSEGRVIVRWMNRLPGTRPDGSFYEFPGLSAITYDNQGRIVEQMDFYDALAAIKVVAEAKTGVAGRAVKRAFGWIGPIAREAMRGYYMLADRARK